MKKIMETFGKVAPGVDNKYLFISLMEKMAKFVGDVSSLDIFKEIQQIYTLLVKHYDSLINAGKAQGIGMDINKLIEMSTAFMKYSIKCSPENERLNAINHILTSSMGILLEFKQKVGLETVKKIGKLLAIPLESKLSLFDFGDFPELMNWLDFNSRNNLSLKIINSLLDKNAVEKVDSLQKLKKLLEYIKPLLIDSNDTIEVDQYTFEYEQNNVCKLIKIINNENINILFDIYSELKLIFANGGQRRRVITLPCLANSILYLCHRISLAFDSRNGLLKEGKKTKKIKEIIEKTNIEQIDSGETLYKVLVRIYSLLNETLTLISQDSPEIALRLYLLAASQVNSIKSEIN